MEQKIILSLLYAEKGLTSDAMKRHHVESPETRETWARLAPLLTPTAEEALELAAEYFGMTWESHMTAEAAERVRQSLSQVMREIQSDGEAKCLGCAEEEENAWN